MILDRLSDPAVVFANFGRDTVTRSLARLDDIEGIEIASLTRTRVLAQAIAFGTAAVPYVVRLEATTSGSRNVDVEVETWCTCPVARQCKHGAALAFQVGRGELSSPFPPEEEPEPPAPDWRHELDSLVRGLSSLAAPSTAPVGLALRFSYDDPAVSARRGVPPGSPPTVRLRPMRPGKRGWVQGGIDWHSLPPTMGSHGYDPRQLEALTMLQHSLGTQYWYHGIERSVSDFGSQVVRLLAEAAASGITLYVAPPLTGLRLVEEKAHAAVDLVDLGEQVELRLAVTFEGRPRATSDLLLLGAPVHTVGMVDDGVLALAGLRAPLAPAVVDALGRRPVVRIPADQTQGLPDYLRRLRRLVPIGSSDESVDVPEPVRPRLRVTVAWQTAARADLSWSWRYGTGPEAPCVPLASHDALDGVRDLGSEREILALWSHLDTSDRAVDGADTVSLALLELPAWRELDGLDVVEVDPPTFREASETPSIAFDLVEVEHPDTQHPAQRPDTEHQDWLDLEVMISIDGERVPLPDVVEALTLGREFLVLPSGLFVSTDQPALAKLAESVRAAAELSQRSGRDDQIRVGRHDLGVLADLGDLGPLTGEAAEWADRAHALRDLVDLPRPEPSGLATTLRSYQEDGFRWLAFLWEHRLGGILADDMGLGKTLQVLALLAHTRTRGSRSPFLVVAPTSVVSAWAEQAALHTPGLRVHAVSASSKRRTHDIATLAADSDLVITSYTLLRLDEAQYAAVEWEAVVLDEAQQVKNHRSQAHQAIRRLRAPFKLAVTGTPFENRLLELWSLLSIVCPGLYPTQSGFNEYVARPVEKHQDDDALRRFTRRLKPFVLRRTKELVAADLPPKQEQVLEVDLHPRHRKLYDSHLAKERQRILGLLEDFDENRVAILAALTRLRQLSLDPGLLDPAHLDVGSAKLDLLVERLLEVTSEGHRALVFSTFTGFLGRARSRLEAAGIAYTYLDGATTDRGRVISTFRQGTAPVFLISLKAGGVGLTLTEADYVFVLDPWWNPAAEAQAVDRAHRIGQDRTVMVYRLVSRETIEEKVMALKARKAALFARVLDGETSMSDGIDADDIRSLFDD